MLGTDCIHGKLDDDLAYSEVGPIVHSRWLTLGCRILRYYVSLEELPLNLEILVRYYLTVYFPTWFKIKQKNQITKGSSNFLNLVQRVKNFSNKRVEEIGLSVVQPTECLFCTPRKCFDCDVRE